MKLRFLQGCNTCRICIMGYYYLAGVSNKGNYAGRLKSYSKIECSSGDCWQSPIKDLDHTCESFMINNINAEEFKKV